MSAKTDPLFDRFYFSRPGYLSGTVEFHDRVRAALGSGRRILEIGAGPDNATSAMLASVGEVHGVDISEEVRENRHLKTAAVYDGKTLPFPDQDFDLCVSDYVLEHIEDAETHFREVARVLRTGGTYCFRTPNIFHYVAMGSRMLPHNLHLKLANPLRGLGQETHDPYPTFYRANSRGALRRLSQRAGLDVRELRMVEKEPSYGRRGAIFFYPMMVYERLVNVTAALSWARANIFGVVEKVR